MTWAEFQVLFLGKYFPDTARHVKAEEFLAEVGGDDCDGLCG